MSFVGASHGLLSFPTSEERERPPRLLGNGIPSAYQHVSFIHIRRGENIREKRNGKSNKKASRNYVTNIGKKNIYQGKQEIKSNGKK